MSISLVSVIIPAFNSEGSIIQAIDSVFAQTYMPIEVIVIDDGSTDNTAELVKDYKKNGLQRGKLSDLIYIYQQNSGPSRARNTGIKAVKGEYIAFLDADDLWMENKIKKQIQLFEKDPNLDIVFTDAKVTRIKKNGIEEFCMFQKIDSVKNYFGNEYAVIEPLEKLLSFNFIHTSSVVIKKPCFQHNLYFNERRRYAEDLELWLKMSLYFNFGYVNEVCMHKIEKGMGLTADKLEMCLSSIEVIETFIKENNIGKLQLTNKRLSKLLKDKFKWTGYYLMRNNHNKLARKFYRKALCEGIDLVTILYYFNTFLRIVQPP